VELGKGEDAHRISGHLRLGRQNIISRHNLGPPNSAPCVIIVTFVITQIHHFLCYVLYVRRFKKKLWQCVKDVIR
jgi:hypothetical protein